ncbi:MAG: HNH endonuclease signature motif containing protein [Actinomycetaceae bacterium]|nr:HNH endonuclease signature motif containing protein [Actinomycetaceae bacterium]
MINVPGLLTDEETQSRGPLSETEIQQIIGQLQRLELHGPAITPKTDLPTLLRQTLTIERYAHAITEKTTALVDKKRATRPLGISTSELLAQHLGLTARECNAHVLAAHRHTQYPKLHHAYATGNISYRSLNKASHALNDIAPHLNDEELNQATQRLTKAAEGTGAGLHRAIRKEKDRIAPADTELAHQLAKQEAYEKRYLIFIRDKYSVTIKGSLPHELADPIIEAVAHQARRIRAEEINNHTPTTRRPARNADALTRISRNYCANLPHVRRLLPLHNLPTDAAPATMRQAVLNTYKGQYDQYREQRLASPQLREIVLARDGGCVFQPCDEHAATCEIHHVTPWRDGGATNLNNLAALCPVHHHALSHDGTDPRKYNIIFSADGYPLIVPPIDLDPERKPIQNDRFTHSTRVAYHAPLPFGAAATQNQETSPCVAVKTPGVSKTITLRPTQKPPTGESRARDSGNTGATTEPLQNPRPSASKTKKPTHHPTQGARGANEPWEHRRRWPKLPPSSESQDDEDS